MKTFLKIITYPFRFLLLCLVKFYKFCISPILPSTCGFVPTCSTYMEQAIKELQDGYDEQINELQDAVETYSALANNPQTFDEFVSEPQVIETEFEHAETEVDEM